jgi:DNA transformation protein
MKGSKAHVERKLSLLLPLGSVQARAMFRGHGLYLEGVMFALLGPDLHLKVDDATKPRFAAIGGMPFTY